jgi:hypothetical protein
MRKSLALLAGLMLPLAPVSAQTRSQTAAPAPAPKLQLTAQHRAELEQAFNRGRMLAMIDRAGYLSRSDMLTRVPNAAKAGIRAGSPSPRATPWRSLIM